MIPMTENNYIMLNLEDEKSSKIAEIMSNKSCKKILSLLAEKELSESDIARQLNLPLNTTEYNLKKLIESSLVEKAKNHFWSIKGKKIPVYKLSNKYIVIAPKSTKNTSLKTFLPVVLITGIVAFMIRFFSTSSTQVQKYFDTAASGSSEIAPRVGSIVNSVSTISPWDKFVAMPIWAWFLIGALFAIILIFILTKLNRRKNKNG
jgi:DNA-binding transcriptional ArsR family regulator